MSMCKKCKIGLIIFLILSALVIIWIFSAKGGLVSGWHYVASIIFPEKITPETLQQKYKNGDIKILIVPGHDKNSYGAQYRGVTEESLNAKVGNYLYDYFLRDQKFSPTITRIYNGTYMEWFTSYAEKDKTEIKSWRDKLKSIMKSFLKTGAVTKNTKVFHNPAADNASLNLYAINKWANENNIDIVLHLHFNDYPGRPYDLPGKYSGFAIYIPESQLPNYRVSNEIGESIKKQLSTILAPSNFNKEKDTLIEDQQLIAVGSNASRDGASILLEYGYIYEDKIYDKNLREQTLINLAYQTYLGIKNYFDLTSSSLKTLQSLNDPNSSP